MTVELAGVEFGGLENDGLQVVNLHGTWLRHVAYTKEWLQSKTWVEQRYNIAQRNVTAFVNVMFSCNDYDNVYALVDWRLIFFSFLVNCICFVLFFGEYDCHYALQYWRNENTRLLVVTAISTYV